MKAGNIFSWERERMEALRQQQSPGRAGLTVTPELVRLRLRLPWMELVWARPVAVFVDRGELQERIPIIDITRRVQVGIWLAAIWLAAAATGLTWRARRTGAQL